MNILLWLTNRPAYWLIKKIRWEMEVKDLAEKIINIDQTMSKNKKKDDRKQLLMRYRIDEKGRVSFIDPCCDEIPARLFGKIMEAISNVEIEWNCRISNKVSSTIPLPEITHDEPISY